MAQALIKIHSPDREVLAGEIYEALDKLPRDLREAFILAHYSNIPLRELAAKQGLGEQELIALISRANRAFFRSLRRTSTHSS